MTTLGDSGRIAPRWYVRGSNESHRYEIKAPYDYCLTCQIRHARPIGRDWHIEDEDVDTMLCGVRVGLDEGEVRLRPAKNICANCVQIANERGEIA